jgi:iron complex outermembrane recepter protein
VRSHYSGWNLLGRWEHAGSPGSQTSLQFYFDRTNRGDTTYPLGLNAYDIDFQHNKQLGHRNEFVWGLGYRLSSDVTEETLRISFTPKGLNTQTFSSFVQDEIAVIPNHLYATVGAKLQHEYYNGLNLQPTARVTWTPGTREMFWAAISGAQRTPSRAETSVDYNYFAYAGANNLIVLTAVFGNPKQRNERLTATEAGFRAGISDRLSFDLATFYNRYTHLASVEPGAPRFATEPPPLHLLVPFAFANLVHAETHGVEVSANLKLASRWTLTPEYSFLSMHVHTDPTSLDGTTVFSEEGAKPDHQAQLRSSIHLPWHWQSTTSAFFVDRLKAQSIPSYTRLDSTLAWEGSDKLVVGFAGQNLIKNLHQEFGGPVLSVEPSLIPRSAYAWLTWRF